MTEHLQQDMVLNALAGGAKSDPFLGNVTEIAIVTDDIYRTMTDLSARGIGPWRVYDFNPSNTFDQTYRGERSDFVLKVCFAQTANMVWELMQPVSGRTIFQDFLDAHGVAEAIHHVAFDCNNIGFEDRLAELRHRGYELVQSGSWQGTNHFAFFEKPDGSGTCFETYAFPGDWAYPEPQEWFPPRQG